MDSGVADALIAAYGLQPHPEGGHYRETFRSAESVTTADGRERAGLTTIFYLLRAGETSRWHRVLSDEVWHFYDGAALALSLAPPAGTPDASVQTRLLGRPSAGFEPVATVPAGWWQSARPLGEYALVGCTVGPGFDFADFAFADAETAAWLESLPVQGAQSAASRR